MRYFKFDKFQKNCQSLDIILIFQVNLTHYTILTYNEENKNVLYFHPIFFKLLMKTLFTIKKCFEIMTIMIHSKQKIYLSLNTLLTLTEYIV